VAVEIFKHQLPFECCRLAQRNPHAKDLLKEVHLHGVMLLLSQKEF